MLKIFLKSLIIFGIVLTTNVNAQTLKSFSKDKDTFYKELYGFIKESNPDLAEALMTELEACFPMDGIDPKKEEKIYKNANKLLEDRFKKIGLTSQFTYNFSSPKFSLNQIDKIISTSNKMLANKLKPVPHFESYILSLLSFINTSQTNESFAAWDGALGKLLDQNRRYFISFIDNCNDVFLQQAIYVNPNLKWLRTKSQFSFEYDSLPKIVFPNPINITCLARDDSSVIYQTKGVYYPTKNIWYGEGGQIYWDRAGKARSVTNAQLGSYKIEMKSPYFEADSVIYKNEKYLKESIMGRLEERVLANQTTDNAVFPQFYSYSERVLIEEIVDSVDYEGGFVINGTKFIGKGLAGVPSKIIFKKFNKPFLVAEANSFIIDDDKIATQGASVKMYLDTDSIFHPYLQLKFLTDKRELTLYKDEKGIGASPYYNTFHKMDMNVEWLKWEIDKSYIEMSAIIGSSTGEVSMESSSYYSAERFRQLQGLEDVHPLYRIRKFIDERNNGEPDFLDSELASFFVLDDGPVKLFLIKLATLGFLQYDIKKGEVQVQDKLYEYLDAKSEKGDYDNISIKSVIKGEPNATMNLINYDISFKGVSGVALSNVRKTGFIPENGQFKLHRNRNMTFSGILRSGNYEFHGKKFAFNYNEFKIDLLEVDSGKLRAKDPSLTTAQGLSAYTMVNSVIEDIRGDLRIDYPQNKSGLRIDSFPEYPKLNCTQNSYVRYNKRNKQGAAYDPSKVYFRLDPFTVDSMGSFSNEGIKFAGSFKSGGIFPEFDEDLVLMPDHSLGFVKKTPPEGFPMYDGKAVFKNEIKLSNEGIKGDGDFEYITSLTQSKSFTFYLDSMSAMALKYKVEPRTTGVEYTDVNAEKVKVHYEATADFMSVKNTSDPIKMYNNETQLNGELIYSPKSMTGNGVTDFKNAELASKMFDFKNSVFDSDTADFKLKTEGEGGIAFSTNNVNSHIDFKARSGDFKSNGGGSYVDFPVNKYICFMDQFKWFMDQFELELSTSDDASKTGEAGAGGDLDLSGSEFISTHPDQDSLKFISPKANYDLKKYIIKAHEVKYINVADSRIYTSDGEIKVEKNAKIDPLLDAKIITNSTTKYHTITNSTVNIKARRNYTAEGDYQYIDASGGKQLVHFNNIRVDSLYQTVASGDIDESQNFMLSPYFSFKGNTRIEANKLGMYFKGGTKLVHDCQHSRPWIPFEAEIDPANVLIPIKEDIKSMDDDIFLAAGVAFNIDQNLMYGNFLAPRKYHSDPLVITANGFLKYSEEAKAYQISNLDKLNEISFPGNFIQMNTESCIIEGEGKINVDANLGQVKMNSFGKVSFNPNNDSLKINMIVALDFFLDESLWKNMMDQIIGNPSLTPVQNGPDYEQSIRNMTSKELGDKLISELNLFGQFKKVPDELVHNIVFSDVNMYWNASKKSFITDGAFGITMIDKKQVNKYVNGSILMERSKVKDELNIYIEIDDKTWYFFSYSKGVMRCLSSSDEFNAIITELKDDKKQSKGEKEDGPYTFMLGTEMALKKFLNKIEY